MIGSLKKKKDPKKRVPHFSETPILQRLGLRVQGPLCCLKLRLLRVSTAGGFLLLVVLGFRA